MTGQLSRSSLVRRALVLAAALVVTASLVPAVAAARASLADEVSSRKTAASPTLAFVRTEHIWRVGADGKGALQLTKGTAEDSSPVWSPDGQTIAFVRSGASGLNATARTVPATGGTPTLLYKSTIPKAVYTGITSIAYTPDGKSLTLAESWVTGSPGDVGRCRIVSYVLATGQTKVLLSRNGGFGPIVGPDWRIAWSPDGATLAVAQSGQDLEGGQTWLFTPSNGDLRRLGANQASFADWAPSGEALLLSTFTQSDSKIQVVSTAGKVRRTLARGGGVQGGTCDSARYSWDGSTVAYTYGARSGTQQVWLMSSTGTGKRKVTTGAQPAWQ